MSREFIYNVTLEDFASAFGISIDRLPDICKKHYANSDFRYRKLAQSERDEIILTILKRMDSGDLTVAGEAGKEIWEKAWAANLERFAESNFDFENLVPDFIRANQVIRLNSDYIMPLEAQFELNFSLVLRQWLFTEYLKDVDCVCDFGCGSGFNLGLLAKLYPQKTLYGLDWTSSAVEMINQLGVVLGCDLKGRLFDFFKPDASFEIGGNTAVLTWGALEQVGDRHDAFLQFVIDKAPALCINVEPIAEWYDPDCLPDYLALQYHLKRGYLKDFYGRLKVLEAQKEIEIISSKRLHFGSLYHEVYSFVVWKPKG